MLNISEMFAQDLAHLSLFEGLNAEQLALIQPHLELCDFSRETTVFEQGELAQYLYIVSRGEILVRYKAYDGPMITVARVGPGGIFGWSAVIGRPTYSSGAICTQDSEVYRLPGKTLRRMCDECPETGIIILDRLANIIDERLRNTHTQILNILTQGVDSDGNCTRSNDQDEQP